MLKRVLAVAAVLFMLAILIDDPLTTLATASASLASDR